MIIFLLMMILGGELLNDYIKTNKAKVFQCSIEAKSIEDEPEESVHDDAGTRKGTTDDSSKKSNKCH